MGGEPSEVKDIHSTTAGKARSQRGAVRASARGPRRNFDKRVTGYLEWVFRHKHYPSHGDRLLFAQQTGLSTDQIKTWFQNRRLKEKARGDKMAATPLSTRPHTAGASTVGWPCVVPTGGVSVEALARLGVLLPPDLATSTRAIAMAMARPLAVSGKTMDVPPTPAMHRTYCGPMPAASVPASSLVGSSGSACSQRLDREGTVGLWHTGAETDKTQLLPGNEAFHGSCDRRLEDMVAFETHGYNSVHGIAHSAIRHNVHSTATFGVESPSPGSRPAVNPVSTTPSGSGQRKSLSTCGQGSNLFTCGQGGSLSTCGQGSSLSTCGQGSSLSTCGQGGSFPSSPGRSKVCDGSEGGVRCGVPGDLGLSLARLVQSWSAVAQ